jgi:hypothetical protein
VVALSQEGSLGSLSDGEPSFRPRGRSPPGRTLSFPEAAALALDLASVCGGVPGPASLPPSRQDISPADAKHVEARCPCMPACAHRKPHKCPYHEHVTAGAHASQIAQNGVSACMERMRHRCSKVAGMRAGRCGCCAAGG